MTPSSRRSLALAIITGMAGAPLLLSLNPYLIAGFVVYAVVVALLLTEWETA